MKKKDEKKNKFKNSRVEQIQYHNSILTVSTSAAREIVRHKKKVCDYYPQSPGLECYFAYFFSSFSRSVERCWAAIKSGVIRALAESSKERKAAKNSRRSMMMMVGMMMMMRPVLDDGRRRCAAIEWRFSDFYRKSLFIFAWNSRKSAIFTLKSASKSHKFSVK